MDYQMQRRLSTLLSIEIGTVLAYPINNVIDEQIPERRGIKDYVTEAVLRGLVRTTAILAASVIMRRVTSSQK